MSNRDAPAETGTSPSPSKQTTGPSCDPEMFQKARAHGWVEPQAYDYKIADLSHNNAGAEGDANGTGELAWAHQAAKYEWKEEYGDVGPVVPELEKQLFHNDFISRQGTEFKSLLTINVTAEACERPDPVLSFADAGLHPVMLENVTKCGYDIPTPIQAYTIPAVMSGFDVIATAQTGSGKTAAFLIPVISKLMGKVKKLAAPRPNLANGFDPAVDRVRAEPLVLVVAPTRELCCQIFDEARRLCYRSMLRPCLAYGGGPSRDQKEELRRGCDVLIASPGRLKDFLNDTSLLSLARVRYTVIDEADEMLHDDWEDEMKTFTKGADASEDDQHQYLLFSATFDKNMRKVARKFLRSDHVRIRIGRVGAAATHIEQTFIWVDRDKKKEALYDLLISLPPSRTLVFVRSKKTADFVDDHLFNRGLPSTSIHSDRTQIEREDSLRAFKSGKSPILIATGVTGRGLDIRDVMHVINFDLPSSDYNGQDEYVHRIGRTARIGNLGRATSFYNDDDQALAPFLTKLLIESNQTVPDFLEEYKPEEGQSLSFDDDSGSEVDDNNDQGATSHGDDGDVWGNAAGDVVGKPATNIVTDEWNVGAGTSVGTGW